MVKLGMTNSRLKDYYDLLVLSTTFELAGAVLTEAVRATFARRETPLPAERPVGLTDEFASASDTRWKAFLRTNDLDDVPFDLPEVSALLHAFVSPVLDDAAGRSATARRWIPGRGWV